MKLTLLEAAPSPKPVPVVPLQEKSLAIQGEVVSALEERIELLRAQAVATHALMEQVLYRIGAQGFHVKLDDLNLQGILGKISAEVQVLQEVADFIEGID